MRKVGIVGIGHVGATVAHLIVYQGLADELVLIDKKPEKVASEALDFSDAASLLDKHIDVHVGDYPDLADADVVISALGHIHLIKPDGDRFGELKANLPMAKQVGADLKAVGFNGVLLAISNPVDVITGIYQQATGLPSAQVIGTGTYLDTARLKRVFGEALGVDPRSVNGYVLGEHGASQFAAWSTVNVMGQNARTWAAEKSLDLDKLENDARVGGFTVHSGKGYTNFAIAHAAVSLLQIILSDARKEAIVSHYNEDFDGYISSPAIIGRGGVVANFDLPLTPEEQDKLAASAKAIQTKTADYS
ncbi:L-lactate dehydrogenase [Leuconostoc pseudomesenteroides]|uniref:L-lactate dehydrogenase n=1 Tax=Leuconostoc pseudomesenteroides TaxID=33968 RepID=UPI0016670BAD|nr:L-lactate dehydrogenase [Leuconostoc pseudomesenteroides]